MRQIRLLLIASFALPGSSCGGGNRLSAVLITDAVEVSCFDNPTVCVVRSNGTVACWGENRYGELGNPDAVAGPTPRDVPLPEGATLVRVSIDSVCALGVSGQTYCWGTTGSADPTLSGYPCPFNSYFTCSTPSALQQPVPFSTISEGGLGRFIFGGAPGEWYQAIAACTGATTDNLALVPRLSGATSVTVDYYVLGGNLFGYACTQPFPQFALPRPAVAVSGSCATLDDGSVACTGAAGEMVVRDSWDPTFDFTAWHPVVGLPPVAKTFAEERGKAACAREPSGDVWCWGEADLVPAPSNSQCPNVTGPGFSCAPPTKIPELFGADISFGGDFACARLPDSTVRCWGNNPDGLLW